MTIINPSIPVAGQPNSSEEPKIVTALTALVGAVNVITDDQIASPPNSVWRTVVQASFSVNGTTAAGTYYPPSTGSGLTLSASSGSTFPVMWVDTGFTLSGKTVNYRIAARAVANTVAPGVTITAGLHPITAIAGSGATNLVITLGAATGGTVALAPTAGAGTSGEGAAISGLSSATTYCPGIVLSGATAGTSYVVGTVALQMRHV